MFFVESFSEVLGYTSMCCWLGAQFPQIVENIKQQSCAGLALPFLFNWMLGDASNLIGCILTHQLPFQTYLATYFCLVDCCLLWQYFYYGGSPKMPPISYPHTRSRTASSARRLSVDASHYRTISVTAGNIATTAAFAAHSDTHPEHRRPRKLGGEPSIDEYSIVPHPFEEPQDEVSDAVFSAISESFISDGGQRKRVSWSRERHEHPPGVSSRRHSPVVPTTLRHSSASAAALLARGRPLEREAETEDLPEEQVIETERRNASRASRRSLGMVMLGTGVLFGIGRYMGSARPVMSRGVKTGAVLVPTSSNSALSLVAGLPVVDNLPNHITDSPHSSVDVELPTLPNDVLFNQQQQLEADMSYDHVVGRIFAWLCTTLYLTSRLPQIWKNYVRKSVEGLSMYLFIFAFLGNFFYVLSIVTSREALLPPPASTEFYRESLPYLLGSGGTFVFDITIVSQSFIYKGKHPRRSFIRSRGNSLVRGAALVEETAGLLRGDTLGATRVRADSVAAPRSQSRG